VDLETFLRWSELAGNLVAAASGLGIVAAIVFAVRSYWDRRRWRILATLVEEWADTDFRAGDELSDRQWKAFTANWLAEAQFSPAESTKCLELAVLFAQARTDFVLERSVREAG
jgi:hypothetical protein